jgi:pimeloyl-ACP methyl ester carboxylesterase
MASLSRVNQRAKLKRYTGPILVLHAVNDRMVDKSHGERLFEWGAGASKRLVMLAEGDHNTILQSNVGEYRQAVQEFLIAAGQSRG